MEIKAEQLKILQDFLTRTQNELYSANLSFKLYNLKKQVNEMIDAYNHVLNTAIDECLIKENNDKVKMTDDGRLEIKEDKKEVWDNFVKQLDEMTFKIEPVFENGQINELKVSPLEIELLSQLEIK